jgi:hypothetical protein
LRSRLRRNLTFANVCSFLALFVALATGGAYAANTVFSTDIVDGEVKNADLADATPPGQLGPQGVSTEKIEDAAITAAKIANAAVGGAQIANGAVGGAQIADGAVASAEVADGAIADADIASDALDGSKVADNSLTPADLRGADVNGAEISVKKGGAKAGGCKDLQIPAPGAAPGETVMISPQAGLPAATVLYGVRVASADEVTIKVCYLKKRGKMPAITGLPVRILTFG